MAFVRHLVSFHGFATLLAPFYAPAQGVGMGGLLYLPLSLSECLDSGGGGGAARDGPPARL